MKTFVIVVASMIGAAAGAPVVDAMKIGGLGAVGGCLGAADEVELRTAPKLTHLQGATGTNDGVSLWTEPNREAAFWDYQTTRDGLLVYLLTGITKQTSCSATRCTSDAASIDAWIGSLHEGVRNGSGPSQTASPCLHLTIKRVGE